MKWLGRFLAFALSILLGIAAASVGQMFTKSSVVPYLTEPFITLAEQEPAVSPSGVVVTYAGLGSDTDGRLYLKFMVHNGLYRPLTYGAHSADSPFARLKANGKELPILGRCGTGIQSFYILPGRSAEFHVYKYEFTTLPQKSDRISAGFHLKPALTDEYGPYFSEPFSLPEEFRKSIENKSWNN